MRRREFIERAAAAGLAIVGGACATTGRESVLRPNLVYVFADQWRAQALRYAGDPNVRTPHLDKLASESMVFTHAVSCCPVCSPHRGCLMTGQYPHTHGIFVNDVPLNVRGTSVAQAFDAAGYATGYIGKWHLDGHGRTNFIPRERRLGFEFWRVLECTHDYNRSYYYGDENAKLLWDGYDAIAQTREAQQYIEQHSGSGPFALFLSWGPPHNPYETAPAECKALYNPKTLKLRENVPADHEAQARRDHAGYYAHCSALDACVGDLMATIRRCGIENDTIFVFTSDHGDMLESQGEHRKQRPWDESIRVPMLIHAPRVLGMKGRTTDLLINSPDIMPTMLGLCGVDVPGSVQGTDYSRELRNGRTPKTEAALIACYSPFGEWTRAQGGREYRGIRTHRYLYVKSLEGPWLLYDNETDPYQLRNLVNEKTSGSVLRHLDGVLTGMLDDVGDAFLPGQALIDKWGYKTDKNGTVPYTG
jgi:arylsulfatase A-like enzyme